MKLERDVVYVSLRESFKRKGCPICGLVEKHKDEWIESLIYEFASDPYVRQKLRRKGFCSHHLWDIIRYVEDHLGIDGLSTSVVLHDLLSTAIQSIEEKGKIIVGDSCILCEFLRENESRYLDALAIWFSSSEFLELFRDSDAIFCMPHLRFILQKLKSREAALKILEIQLEKMIEINSKLRSFINKFDYNVKEAITAEEANARNLVVEVLRGRDV